MAELSQALATLQASSSPLIAHSEPPRLPINQLIEQDEVPELVAGSSQLQIHGELPRDPSAPPSSPLVVDSEPTSAMVESQVDSDLPLLPDAASSPLVDDSELLAPLHLITLPSSHQAEQPLSSLPIAQGELLETTPESQAKHREPLVAESNPQERTALGSSPVGKSEPPAGGPAVEAAVEIQRTVEETPHLTREQLGKRFGKTREAVRQWEQTGKLTQMGWEPVPGTGRSPKNPRLYRPVV